MSEIIRTTVEENDSNIVKSQVMNVLDDKLIRHQVRGLEQPAPEPPVLVTLNATENGTYTPEEGVDGFDEVNVDVELHGDTAYDLKDAPSGSISTFTDGVDLPLNKLVVDIEPVQSGSGEPSPTNVRPINGWTSCTITNKDDLDTPTVTKTYNVEFKDGNNPLTVYGGTVDAVNGVLTVDRAMVDLGDLRWTYDSSSNRWQSSSLSSVIKIFTNRNADMISDKWLGDITALSGSEYKMFNSNGALYFYTSDGVNSPTGNLVYLLATPITYNITPIAIRSLEGVNNVFADTGDIEELEYFYDVTTEIKDDVIAFLDFNENYTESRDVFYDKINGTPSVQSHRSITYDSDGNMIFDNTNGYLWIAQYLGFNKAYKIEIDIVGKTSYVADDGTNIFKFNIGNNHVICTWDVSNSNWKMQDWTGHDTRLNEDFDFFNGKKLDIFFNASYVNGVLTKNTNNTLTMYVGTTLVYSWEQSASLTGDDNIACIGLGHNTACKDFAFKSVKITKLNNVIQEV